jgi:uncharacterized protein (TIGR02246 family)
MNSSLITLTLALAVTACAGFAYAQNAGGGARKSESKDAAEIRAVLSAQAEAWNRGDVDGYMAGYAKSPNTIMLSGDQITRGWQTVRDRYKNNYNSPEKMGKLDFDGVEINLLSKDAAVVIGSWALTRAGDNPHGRFTLIFRRLPEGWRIVHDHTSSAS